MKASILSKLDNLNERYQEVGALLSDAEIIAEQNKFRDLSKEYAELEPVVKAYLSYQEVINNLDEARLLLKDSDPDMRAMAQEELAEAESRLEPLELDLQRQLLPKDPNDDNNVFVHQKKPNAHTATITLSGSYGTDLSLTQSSTSAAQSYSLTQNCQTIGGCSISATQN